MTMHELARQGTTRRTASNGPGRDRSDVRRIGVPWIAAAVITVALTLGACDATPKADDRAASSTQRRIVPRTNDAACLRPAAPQSMRCAMWVDAYRGEPLTYGDMMTDVAGARIVYVGERHGIGRHHHIQARIVASLIERGVSVVLAMEQLEAYCQPDVDRYNRGEITFEELADAIDWKSRWKNYDQYRGAIEAAHDAGAPILALNARRETVRDVAMKSIDGLEPEIRAELPTVMHLDDPMYRDHMDQVMMVHASIGEDMLQRMFEAQVARDETMADRLCEFLQSPAGKDRVAVVLCGAGHIAHSMGIPSRVRRRMPDIRDRILVLSHSGDVEISESMKAQSRDITITHEQLRVLNVPIADYLYVTSLKPSNEGNTPQAFFGIDGGIQEARRIVYVMDRSGSMLDRMDGLRTELKRSIDSLRDDQRFHVIFYNDRQMPNECPPGKLVNATPARKQEAFEFIDHVEAIGSTNALPAMQRALEMKPDLIFFLADGVIPMASKLRAALNRLNADHKVRIHTIAYVDDQGAPLLETIAREHRGQFKYVVKP